MSIEIQYVAVCDGVKGPYGHKLCPNNARTPKRLTKEEAIHSALEFGGFKQLYPDNSEQFVCHTCCEEYKRWTKPPDFRR